MDSSAGVVKEETGDLNQNKIIVESVDEDG